jgi:hypothetical protein
LSRSTCAVLDETVGDGAAVPVLGGAVVDDDSAGTPDVADPTRETWWPVPLTVVLQPASSAAPISAASSLPISHPRTAALRLYTRSGRDDIYE